MDMNVRILLVAIVVPAAAATVDSVKVKPDTASPRRAVSVLEELTPVHRHQLWWPKAEPPRCPPTQRRNEA